MDDNKMLQKISRFLTGRHESLAVAESVTSGQLQAALSLAPDATLFFQGGITAYNIQQKYRHLHIDPVQALTCNCVSESIAAEMATNVCKLFLSDWGIGITGYASPIPDVSLNELFACYAIVYKGNIQQCGTIRTVEKGIAAVQLFYVEKILKEMLLLTAIDNKVFH